MQAINVTAVTPGFMTALFGTAVLCLAVGIIAVGQWGTPFAALLVIGSLTYLIGVVAVTVAFHVPRNDALATVDPDRPDAADLWSAYHRAWTRGNHLRATAGIIGSAAFIWAVHVG